MFKISMANAKSVTVEMPEKYVEAIEKQKKREKELKKENLRVLPREEVLRELKIREFFIKDIKISDNTKICNNTLYIDSSLTEEALKISQLVKKITFDVIYPENRNIFTNTIMDIIPVMTKVEGKIGEGITHILNGMVVFLTGVDEEGKQVSEFGSSHGVLKDKVAFNMPGTPGTKDIIFRINVVIEKGTGMERRGPLAAHQVADFILDRIRQELKKLSPEEAANTVVYKDVRRKGLPKVLIVKELGGQGAMHEKIIMPSEPGGVRGGKSIIDLGNVPIILTPNEVKDGGIHSVT
ncbi:glycine/sarcosine/betaine reductase component B subunit [Thermovenabulum sp.]|uniref:glycine/sarcosine/betaine reductase component B subunit n=1 Tax=Thermovenabulum sp. TaxID=3100335 RepID=UPI003C79D1D6